MIDPRFLARAARSGERSQPEDAGSGAPGESFVWDREMDGPEAFVVIRAPSRTSSREFAKRLGRSALWLLVACGFMEVVRAMLDR